MKIDWGPLWDAFDKACDEWRAKHSHTCKQCDHYTMGDPEWEDQMKIIQRLVTAEIQRLKAL